MTAIENLMNLLNCTEEQAKDIIACDKAIDKGERVYFDLDKEQEKVAKKFANIGTHKATGEPTERKRKENPTKATIISEIAELLNAKGYDLVEITNKERQIAFKFGENDYEITLTQKRKPKN